VTDKELLEKAAMAAGMDVEWVTVRFASVLHNWDTGSDWNPLTDDGDALRLAVKLRIEVDYYLADVQAKHDDCDPVFELFSEHPDPYAATRRAIVRAASALADKAAD
jgi:hypothetical protein